MSDTELIETRRIEHIFHPSDFSEASEIAFAHALKAALASHAKLYVLHVTGGANTEWHDFPGVRGTLERWNILPKNSPRSAIPKLGIDIQKVIAEHSDPVRTSLEFLEKNSSDLIVLAVHPHEGRMGWLRKSVGEPIARGAGQMTLFIPHGVEGFVSRKDGAVSLRTILVPVAPAPRPQPAIEAAHRMIRSLRPPAGKVVVLYVGSSDDMPAFTLPEEPGWTWERQAQQGEVVETILKTSREISPDLIIMTTEGPHGFLDALRGSTTARVLHQAHCPLLSLPVGSLLG